MRVRETPSRSPRAASRDPDAACRDYTPQLQHFLEETHGRIRIDEAGDYRYERVSAISLHFVLQAGLPAEEILWQWYQLFDQERGESIYRTLLPQQDQLFWQLLRGCRFRWNPNRLQEAGLLFLEEHLRDAYLAIEDFVSMRLEAFLTMEESALRTFFRDQDTHSDAFIRRRLRGVQSDLLIPAQRQAVYRLFSTPYLRATAREVIGQAAHESFWRDPPNALAHVGREFERVAQWLSESARRLGCYRDPHAETRRSTGETHRASGSSFNGHSSAIRKRLALLGLRSDAALWEVRQAYRIQIKAKHPDHGGAVVEFLRLQEAYEYLLRNAFS